MEDMLTDGQYKWSEKFIEGLIGFFFFVFNHERIQGFMGDGRLLNSGKNFCNKTKQMVKCHKLIVS